MEKKFSVKVLTTKGINFSFDLKNSLCKLTKANLIEKRIVVELCLILSRKKKEEIKQMLKVNP